MKRPNLPNYLAPPPPQTSQSIQEGRLGDNNCETPVLPPLASPEIDLIASPLNKELHAASKHGDSPVVVTSNNNNPQYFSTSQNIHPNTPSISHSQMRKDDTFAGNSGLTPQYNAQQNVVNSPEESLSRYEQLGDAREKQFARNDSSLGKSTF